MTFVLQTANFPKLMISLVNSSSSAALSFHRCLHPHTHTRAAQVFLDGENRARTSPEQLFTVSVVLANNLRGYGNIVSSLVVGIGVSLRDFEESGT